MSALRTSAVKRSIPRYLIEESFNVFFNFFRLINFYILDSVYFKIFFSISTIFFISYVAGSKYVDPNASYTKILTKFAQDLKGFSKQLYFLIRKILTGKSIPKPSILKRLRDLLDKTSTHLRNIMGIYLNLLISPLLYPFTKLGFKLSHYEGNMGNFYRLYAIVFYYTLTLHYYCNNSRILTASRSTSLKDDLLSAIKNPASTFSFIMVSIFLDLAYYLLGFNNLYTQFEAIVKQIYRIDSVVDITTPVIITEDKSITDFLLEGKLKDKVISFLGFFNPIGLLGNLINFETLDRYLVLVKQLIQQYSPKLPLETKPIKKIIEYLLLAPVVLALNSLRVVKFTYDNTTRIRGLTYNLSLRLKELVPQKIKSRLVGVIWFIILNYIILVFVKSFALGSLSIKKQKIKIELEEKKAEYMEISKKINDHNAFIYSQAQTQTQVQGTPLEGQISSTDLAAQAQDQATTPSAVGVGQTAVTPAQPPTDTSVQASSSSQDPGSTAQAAVGLSQSSQSSQLNYRIKALVGYKRRLKAKIQELETQLTRLNSQTTRDITSLEESDRSITELSSEIDRRAEQLTAATLELQNSILDLEDTVFLAHHNLRVQVYDRENLQILQSIEINPSEGRKISPAAFELEILVVEPISTTPISTTDIANEFLRLSIKRTIKDVKIDLVLKEDEELPITEKDEESPITELLLDQLTQRFIELVKQHITWLESIRNATSQLIQDVTNQGLGNTIEVKNNMSSVLDQYKSFISDKDRVKETILKVLQERNLWVDKAIIEWDGLTSKYVEYVKSLIANKKTHMREGEENSVRFQRERIEKEELKDERLVILKALKEEFENKKVDLQLCKTRRIRLNNELLKIKIDEMKNSLMALNRRYALLKMTLQTTDTLLSLPLTVVGQKAAYVKQFIREKAPELKQFIREKASELKQRVSRLRSGVSPAGPSTSGLNVIIDQGSVNMAHSSRLVRTIDKLAQEILSLQLEDSRIEGYIKLLNDSSIGRYILGVELKHTKSLLTSLPNGMLTLLSIVEKILIYSLIFVLKEIAQIPIRVFKIIKNLYYLIRITIKCVEYIILKPIELVYKLVVFLLVIAIFVGLLSNILEKSNLYNVLMKTSKKIIGSLKLR